MTWYAVHNDLGVLVSVGEVVAEPLPAGLIAVALTHLPDWSQEVWDETTCTLVPRPPSARLVDPYEWQRRFTVAEESAIRLAAQTDGVLATLLARLAAAQATMRMIDLDSDIMIGGLAHCCTIGLLTAARAQELRA